MSESPWTFDTESTATGGVDTVTLVEGPTFALSGRSGDILSGGVAGLYMLDTRILSRWQLSIDDRRVEALSVTPDGPFASTFVGRVHLDGNIDEAIVVIQRRSIGRGMREDLELRHYGATARTLELKLEVAADFRHVFDVKADHPVDVEAPTVTPMPSGISIVPAATGRTPVERCRVDAFPEPDHTGGDGSITWSVDLDAGGSWKVCLEVTVEAGGIAIEPASRCGTEPAHAVPVARLASWRHSASRISTDHPALSASIERAVDDLGALRIFDPDHVDRTVVAAGAPWFMTLFGRDSLLTSWMALMIDHDLALGVLAELADTQGRSIDASVDEQPGRILHEVRFDRLSARLLGGRGRYYGSVDATPLFVMLTAELMRWIGPDERVAEFLPAVDRAIEWIDRFGDLDGDGFVEYLRGHPSGLEHQGWKDSWDGIRHADGSVAAPPIALCEVQAYVYAAYLGRAELARGLGEPAELVREFEARAERLRTRFDDVFWSEPDQRYIVGLDADKRPITSLASNLGHLLWTGIVPESRGGLVAAALTSPVMFSGWGIRTLAADSPGYNPLSYHCGSVWPHDTALAIDGLARYGCDDAVARLAGGLLDASTFSGGRLPELFAGFDRRDVESPVPYPASCSPQAWAAAAPLLLVRSLLGLRPDAASGRLALRPRVPGAIGSIRVSRLPIGTAVVDIEAHGDEVDVDVVSGRLDIDVR